MPQLYAGIEGGGTKFIAAVGTAEGEILAETRIPTTTPEETLGACINFFKAQEAAQGKLSAIGIATFGPVELRKSAADYGYITSTPKLRWANANLLTPFRDAFGLPIGLDTDVNGAALGEWRWGAAQGLDTFLYFTIGTGIGGGALIQGQLLHGLLHPEMGHISLPRKPEHTSICPFHADCFEGLASGPALEHHWGEKAENFGVGHPAWETEASYIASALRSFICALSPERIILGGGVMSQEHIFPLIRQKTLAELNGYVQAPEIVDAIDEYIVPVALDGKAGILGAFVLAEQALKAPSS
jgi:fructokinase